MTYISEFMSESMQDTLLYHFFIIRIVKGKSYLDIDVELKVSIASF